MATSGGLPGAPKPLLFFASTTALAGEDRNSACCGYGDRQFCPVHPIGANGMPPGNGISPRCPERIVLEKQMVLALIVDEPVWIIHPVFFRREMELRAIRLLVGRDALSKGTLAESQGQYGCRSQKIGLLAASLSSSER